MTDVTYRKGSETENVHMLNGTLTAIERTLTCIMENYYDSEK
jgi:seryl-tRNA synthetase